MHKLISLSEAKKTLSLNEKVGQFFMPAAFINDTEAEIQNLEKLIGKNGVGSICFFHSRASAATNYEGKKEVVYNAKSLERLKQLIDRYQRASKIPLLIAIDAEWGLAMRIEETPQYPYALTLGAINNNPQLIKQVGLNIGLDCKKAGIHWNLCPAVDINNNAENPVIGYRSFGDNPKEVYKNAMAFIQGMDKSGTLNSIKHFPGHGDTAVDSHLGLPRIDKSKAMLLQNELYPFKNLIENGVDSVMVGHLAVPALSMSETQSATLSKALITGFLRNELGHKGVVITDALNMHSVSKLYADEGQLEWEAFDAGNDVLCFAEHTLAGIQKIIEKAPSERIENSFERIWKLKEKAFATQVKEIIPVDYKFLLGELAIATLTVVKGNESQLPEFYEVGFEAVQIGTTKQNHFAEALFGHTSNKEKVVIGIFPPQMKPQHNFGLTENDITKINELIENKEAAVYLFGNPYAL
ncbi:MAG: glycoside hydrolase family 3 protein, partial [Croceitalea sp.]|nr:glycoside hydrolase family 3 protein [Croceitalea sp.]